MLRFYFYSMTLSKWCCRPRNCAEPRKHLFQCRRSLPRQWRGRCKPCSHFKGLWSAFRCPVCTQGEGAAPCIPPSLFVLAFTCEFTGVTTTFADNMNHALFLSLGDRHVACSRHHNGKGTDIDSDVHVCADGLPQSLSG